jgi:outer membrane protein assembly factor BamB
MAPVREAPQRAYRAYVRRAPVVFAVVVLAALLLTGCDWSALEFSAANTNFNGYEPRLSAQSVPDLAPAWSAPCACRARALVAAGSVYVVGGYTEAVSSPLSLRAFDATTGTPRWSVPLGRARFATVSAVANGLVYVMVRPASAPDRILAFDVGGARRWRRSSKAGSGVVLSPPIVDGKLAFVAANNTTRSDVVAIGADGHVAWSTSPGGTVSAVTVDAVHDIVYAASYLQLTTGPTLYLLTGYGSADGELRSRTTIDLDPDVPVTTLGFSNGLVFGSQPNRHGEGGVGAFAVRPATGAIAWRGFGGEVAAVTPAATLEYNERDAPSTTAHDNETGATLWQADGEPQAVAGDLVYSTDPAQGSGIVVRRTSDGTVVTSLPGSGALTPSNGRLYAAGQELVAYAPSP